MTVPKLTISSSRLRLTLTYLVIIMALTLAFSAIFYQQSISEARSNLIQAIICTSPRLKRSAVSGKRK
jgi:hypothetical protein